MTINCASTPAGLDLQIAIGGMPLALNFTDEHLRESAETRYERFQVNLDRAPELAFPIIFEPHRTPEPASRRFTYKVNGASLMLADNAAYFRGVRHEYHLDSLLRILLTQLLLPREGFLLHAATVVRDRHAYVLVGRSGVGKSTAASLSPTGSVLTDEISLLRRDAGGWHAHGTPFWGEFRAEGSNCRAPLAGLYLLHQAGENRCAPLSKKEGLRALFQTVLFFSASPQDADTLFQVLGRAVAEVPMYRLYFRRDPHFWDAVTS